jgi:CheY-like chemotaxis protein
MPEILVVDNHPLVREFLSQLLAREGHTVHVAEDGLPLWTCWSASGCR